MSRERGAGSLPASFFSTCCSRRLTPRHGLRRFGLEEDRDRRRATARCLEASMACNNQVGRPPRSHRNWTTRSLLSPPCLPLSLVSHLLGVRADSVAFLWQRLLDPQENAGRRSRLELLVVDCSISAVVVDPVVLSVIACIEDDSATLKSSCWVAGAGDATHTTMGETKSTK